MTIADLGSRSPVGFVVERMEQRVLLSTSAVQVPSVSDLVLINASTAQPVAGASLQSGAVIDLGVVGHELSIVADVSGGTVGSVRFNYDGNPNYGIDNSAPYAIAGEANNGRLIPWLPTVGMHTLIVTSFSGPDGSGQPGQPFILLFNVIDSSTPAAPVRINAGGPAYIDSSGNAFSADSLFRGGQQRFSDTPIAGTADPVLYQTWRQGKHFSFSDPLPDDTYAVTLYFADPGLKKTGDDIFDVAASGVTLLDHFNIDSDVGPLTGDQKSFIIPVTNGRLDLEFHAEHGDALVSAITVVPQRIPLVASPLYVNAGGLSYTDSVGRTFEPGIGFLGGDTSQAPVPVAGTADTPLFYSYRSSSQFSFSQPVANGDYELWLEFTEPTFTQPGQRVFNVTANSQPILTNYDIVADAGAGQAVAKAFDVQVTGGSLNLSLEGVVGDAIVSSVVLIPKDVPEAAAPYAVQNYPAAAAHADVENLHAIGEAIFMYTGDHKGHLPASLPALLAYLDSTKLVDPRTSTLIPRGEVSTLERLAWATTLNDYIYLGAGKRASTLTPSTPIAYDNPDRVSGDINILFADGRVWQYSRADAAQILGIAIGDPTHAPSPTIPPPPGPKILLSQLNLQIIGLGAIIFGEEANRNGLQLPPDMGTLSASNDIDPQVFVNPRGTSPPPPSDLTTWEQKAAWVNSTTDYIYVGAHKSIAMPPGTPIAFENPATMADGLDMVFGDDHVEFREMRWAVETILHDRAAFPRSYA